MKALLYKRFHMFTRDLKGFFFLILIPIAIVLAIVAVLKVGADFPKMPCDAAGFSIRLCVVLSSHRRDSRRTSTTFPSTPTS